MVLSLSPFPLLPLSGLATGIALVVYGREEEADPLILQLTSDADPLLRHGGMYALALAYRGTANNGAVRQLLHFAVSDVSDDVRRAAVMSLGFVLYSEPEQVRGREGRRGTEGREGREGKDGREGTEEREGISGRNDGTWEGGDK